MSVMRQEYEVRRAEGNTLVSWLEQEVREVLNDNSGSRSSRVLVSEV